MGQDIVYYLYLIPVILISLTFHEFSHAWVSYKLGDPTAKMQGRLTLNPLKHLDPIGTLMMFVARVGWAKPVPINPVYYKDRKKGSMLVSIAGPLSNILLAFIFSFPMRYIEVHFSELNVGKTGIFMLILFNIAYLSFYVNINVAIFNLIPLPPLDGSKILTGILPERQYFKIMQYERIWTVIFLILVFTTNILGKVLILVSKPVQRAILLITNALIK